MLISSPLEAVRPRNLRASKHRFVKKGEMACRIDIFMLYSCLHTRYNMKLEREKKKAARFAP